METLHNIRFQYLYRDAGNYKFRASVIFSNPNDLPIEEILIKLKVALIDGQYFIPSVCAIPIVYTAPYDPELDHEWYELEEIELTSEDPTDPRTIDAFIQHCAGYGNPYW